MQNIFHLLNIHNRLTDTIFNYNELKVILLCH
jgi:hypothetical protein